MLLTEFGCAVECFASPLNCRHLRSPSGVRCCVPCCTPLGCALHVVRCCIAVMHTRAVSAIRAAQSIAQVRAVLLGALGRGRRVRIAWLILRLPPARRQLPGEQSPCSSTRINAAQRGMAARCNGAEYVAAL